MKTRKLTKSVNPEIYKITLLFLFSLYPAIMLDEKAARENVERSIHVSSIFTLEYAIRRGKNTSMISWKIHDNINTNNK